MPCIDPENTPLPGDLENVLLRKLLNRLCNISSGGGGGGVSQAYVDARDAATLVSANTFSSAGLAGKENVANKSTDGTFAANSDTLYPSQKAAKTYVDNAITVTAAGLYVLKAGDTMTGALLLPSGAVATPSLSHAADANTGLWFPAADMIAFSTSGTERLRFLSTGEVGIGTTSPADLLSVVSGNATVARASNATSSGFYLKTGAAYDWSFRSLAGNSDLVIRSDGVGEAITILKTSLFVGIGTTSPSMPLDVRASTLNQGQLIYNTSNTDNQSVPLFIASTNGFPQVSNISIEAYAVSGNGSAANLQIRTGATTATGFGSVRMTVLGSNGNVGIGIATPLARLHVTPAASGTDYFRIDHSDGTPRHQFGSLAAATTLAGIWLGNITPNNNNYAILGDGADTYIGAPGIVYFSPGSSVAWELAAAGHLLAFTDNTYDIGASGATRPRNGYFAGGIIVGSVAALVTSSAAMNDGAAAALGTLTNAPVAGNPTKWVPINDNGTTRYFPAW